jgi:hypothetical protein
MSEDSTGLFYQPPGLPKIFGCAFQTMEGSRGFIVGMGWERTVVGEPQGSFQPPICSLIGPAVQSPRSRMTEIKGLDSSGETSVTNSVLLCGFIDEGYHLSDPEYRMRR